MAIWSATLCRCVGGLPAGTTVNVDTANYTGDEGEIAATRILPKEIVWTHELAEKLIAKHGDVLA